MSDLYRIDISPEALSDLTAIHTYIAQDSPDNADKMIERILSTIELLQTSPHRFIFQRHSSKIRHPVRSVPIRPYIIYFRVIDHEHTIRILTIRHGARKRPRHFE